MSRSDEPYPPISDYAVIGDCRSAALVSARGSIDWCCWPDFDSAPVFGRMLDWSRGGFFSIAPVGEFTSTQQYLPGTNVVETTFECESGVVRVIDLMPALREEEKAGKLLPLRSLIRRVEGVEGKPKLRMTLHPRPRFGRVSPRLERRSPFDVVAAWHGEAVHLRSDLELRCDDHTAICEFDIAKNERHYFSLVFTNDAPSVYPSVGERADWIIDRSIDFWRTWSSRARYDGPYRDAVVRSALTLKLMSFAPSGAIVAAPTSSLPEWIGGPRNWDYRYCWLRDASFTARALYNLGFSVEGDAYAHWLMYSTKMTHPGLQVMYSLYGESRLMERELKFLSGYRDSRPVRIGNDAHNQFQLDVYGELLGAIEAFTRGNQDLGRSSTNLVETLANFVCDNWNKPDSGIWEQRAGEFHHVHGKALAWVALDCAVRLAEQWKTKKKVPAERWRTTRDEIREVTLRRGYNEKLGTFVATWGGSDLDGSLLTLPMVGFVRGDDPRMLRTIDAIRRDIAVGELVYRYRRPDGLPGDEGAFLACSFWLVSALAHAGRTDEAHDTFEKLLKRANHAGLFSEEIDPHSGAFLGNFPQGLTHIALITAATTLAGQRSDHAIERT